MGMCAAFLRFDDPTDTSVRACRLRNGAHEERIVLENATQRIKALFGTSGRLYFRTLDTKTHLALHGLLFTVII